MIYLNYATNKYGQYTFEQLFNNELVVSAPEIIIKTLQLQHITPQAKTKLINKYNIVNKAQQIKRLIQNTPINYDKLKNYYTIFKIPKHSGGLRTISAPTGALKTLLHGFYTIIAKQGAPFLPHDSAYAYTTGRDCYKALQKHQDNASNWFLKLDIKDFFPNCNKELIMDKLTKVFPFNFLYELIPTEFETMINYCLLDNQLPQGTNMSPMLTNAIMVEFDVKFSRYCEQHGLIYTRYADDMLISSKDKFNFIHVQNVVINFLRNLNYNFTIKKEKTRFGSNKGSNWNLGLMLNANNNITIGYKKKKLFKAMLNNFICENILTTENKWSIMDIQHLYGLYSYYLRIEPQYIAYVISQFDNKYNVNTIQALKQH